MRRPHREQGHLLYHEARPGYPEALFDAVVTLPVKAAVATSPPVPWYDKSRGTVTPPGLSQAERHGQCYDVATREEHQRLR